MEVAKEDRAVRERMHRLNDLLKEIEQFRDPQARARTREIVQALLGFHSAALRKLLETVASGGDDGLRLIDKVAENDLVAGMLLLYGLHPLDLESRVRAAIKKVQPALDAHGGNVQLLSVQDGLVRLRLLGSCQHCPSSVQTLQQTIEEAIFESAPDVIAIEVIEETVPAPTVQRQPGNFALPILAAK